MYENIIINIKKEIMEILHVTEDDDESLTEKKALFKIIKILLEKHFIEIPKKFFIFNNLSVDFGLEIENYLRNKILKIDITKQYLPDSFCEYFNVIERKKSHGEVFTPKDITEFMIYRTQFFKELSNLDICDYASGNGAILYNIVDKNLPIKTLTAVDIQHFSSFLTFASIVLSNKSYVNRLDVDSYDTLLERNKFKKKFDLVISNPPYMGQKGNQKLFIPLKKDLFWSKIYESKSDYQYFFIVQAIELLKAGGIACLITTQYWLTATKGNKLREYICKNANVLEIHDFGSIKLFPNATGQENIIILLQKKSEMSITDHVFPYIVYNREWVSKNKKLWENKKFINKEIIQYLSNLEENTKYTELATFHKVILTKSEVNGSPWYHQKSDYDSYEKKNNDLILKYFKTQPGIQTGADKVNVKNKFIKDNSYRLSELNYSIGDGIYVLTKKELTSLNLNNKEKEVVKKFFKSSHVQKYGIDLSINLYLLKVELIDDINEYPNIKKHLSKYKDILNARFKTYSLKNYEKVGKWWKFVGERPNIPYIGEKIINVSRVKEPFFLYSNSEFYSSMDIFYTYSLENKSPYSLKFLCAYLNSEDKVSYLKRNCKKKGIKYELYKDPISNIPLPLIKDTTNNIFREIIELIGGRYSLKENNNFKYSEISNTWIESYGLYDFILKIYFDINRLQIKYKMGNLTLSDLNKVKDEKDKEIIKKIVSELSEEDYKELDYYCQELILPKEKYHYNLSAINYMINNLINKLV